MPIFYERDEDLENQLNRGALWAVTYGDLMSYLMIFFLMMFAFGINPEALKMLAREFGAKIEDTKPKTEVQVKEETLAEQLAKILGKDQVQVTQERVMLTLPSPVLFDEGEAVLKPDALRVLGDVAQVVNKVGNPIMVEGHTDNRPLSRKRKYADNWELSMARSHAVVRYLTEGVKVAPGRITGAGYGEHHPAHDNSTSAGRARNRRIEISILRQKGT